MQLKVLLQTKRPHVKPNSNRLVNFTPLKPWRRNLSKKAGVGKELDFHSQNSGIAICKVCESSSIISDMNSKKVIDLAGSFKLMTFTKHDKSSVGKNVRKLRAPLTLKIPL
jgi:hypothetical protein